MTGLVNLYFCLVALFALARAFPSDDIFEDYLNLNEYEDPINKEKVNEIIANTIVAESSDTPSNETESSTTTTKNEPKVEKPVNELFPYAVLVGGICGGTIISSTWILSAAHCTIGYSDRYILAGTNNSADGSGTVRRIKRKVIHPRFLVGPYWLNAKEYHLKQVRARYDFLLVELEEPLPLDDVIMKAAKLNKIHKLAPKTNVSYAGYGTDHHGGYMSHNMHARKLELLSEKECAALFEYNRRDMVCAKGRPPNFDSACNGDSGSGLVNDKGVLVGVTSWVEDDAVSCHSGAKVYFAKVAVARKWIREVAQV